MAAASGVPLRDRLRTALTAAMKARDTTAVSALRSVLGVIDNAEAADHAHAPAAEHGVIAGGVAGLGAGEVARVELTEAEVEDIVRVEIEERRTAAAALAGAGQDGHVDRLVAEAEAIERVLWT